MDKLTSFMVFVKVVDCGSLSAAGETLQMSSQLVGKHIKELETKLGMRLLNRTTRRQSLTDFGHNFYNRARIILDEVDAAENLAAERRSVPSGILKVGAPVSFGTRVISVQLPKFMKQYPQVQIDLKLNNSFVDFVDEGFDIVFRVGELTDSNLMTRSLAPYRLILCASPDYISQSPEIKKPEDLIHHSCLVYSHAELRTHWTFDGPNGRITIPILGNLLVDNEEPLYQAALSGMGIILQPIELVHDALNTGKLVELLPNYKAPTRPMHIIFSSKNYTTPALRKFIDFSVNAFGKNISF